jgi:hypothetical protein
LKAVIFYPEWREPSEEGRAPEQVPVVLRPITQWITWDREFYNCESKWDKNRRNLTSHEAAAVFLVLRECRTTAVMIAN